MNPLIVEQTTYGTNQISIESKLYNQHRIIMVNDSINSETASSIIQQLLYLQSVSPDPIYMFINSPGGSVVDGLSIIDIMQASPCKIHTITLGVSASMGALLASAGCPNHRYINPNGRIMIHEPLLYNEGQKSCSSIQTMASSILQTRNQINKMLAEFTGHSVELIEKESSYDHWFTAQEACDFNLVDKILTSEILNNILGGNQP